MTFNSRSPQQNRNGQPNRTYGDGQKVTAETTFSSLKFNTDWITKEADKELVIYAEEAGKYMANNGLTNSKIRSIFGEIKRIQMGVFENEKASFYLLKPKVAYALGRDPRNEGLILFKKIFDHSYISVSDGKSFVNFSNLLEAILAYHKSFGGKD